MSTLEMQTPERKVPEDNFGNRLRLVRAESGLSAERLGALCGVTDVAYYKWERGGRCRGMDRVVNAICEATGYDRDWLMWGGPLDATRSRCLSDTCTSEYVPLTFDFEAYEEQTPGDYTVDSRLVSCGHAA